MVHFAAADILLIVVYFCAVVYVGFRAVRNVRSETADFLLAGRTLTLPVFVATLVSTWYGGILGVGEYSYRYGISNWIVLGVPYYVFALIFALFLAKKIRSTNYVTIPDKLESEYGRRTAFLGSVLTFFLVTPSAYILMIGILAQLIFGIDLVLSMVLTTVVTVCYLYWGGFRSNIRANILEFVLMFLGFALILPFAYSELGGVSYLTAHLPSLHLTWNGGNPLQYVVVWFFIALWTLVDPAFHQRCYAARDGATAQKGILVSIGFWFVFDFMTSAAGLYARAALPDLSDPAFAYPMLAELVLPPVAKGLFYIGMLATVMSTLSSLMFISASTIGKDIAGRLVSSSDRARQETLIHRWTKLGLVLSAVFSILLAVAVPSVVRIWYSVGTAIIPGLLVPLMASYFEPLRITGRFAFWAMLLGWLVSTVWLIGGQIQAGSAGPAYWLGLEPMYPGLALSLLLWSAGRVSYLRSASGSKRTAVIS